LRPTAVTGFEAGSTEVVARLGDGASASARLLVAADGARSRLRELAGIASYGWTYPQSAIVTNVAHERDHNGRACEHFLPAGPFPPLPLKGRRSSIVWTEEAEAAQHIVALPDDRFHAALERRFGLELGEIEVIGPRRVHPLGYSVARAFVAGRLALIGYPSRVIHPLPGHRATIAHRPTAPPPPAAVPP